MDLHVRFLSSQHRAPEVSLPCVRQHFSPHTATARPAFGRAAAANTHHCSAHARSGRVPHVQPFYERSPVAGS